MSQLPDLLVRELQQLSDFITLLSDEQEALKQGEVSKLQEITPRKQAMVGALNETESARIGLLGLGLDETPKSAMARWLDAHPGEKSARADWQKLLERALQAKRLHEVNGQLVALHLQHTNEMLDALGIVAKNQATLYGSDGMAEKPSGSRIVDSA